MTRTIIRMQCVDQTLHIISKPTLASGGINEDIIKFSFCDLWEGFAKVAIFYTDPELPYFQPLDENDSCIIPWEVLTKDGVLYIGVFGEGADGTLRTSKLVSYKIAKGAITEGLNPSDPTPELWEQMLALARQALQGSVHSFNGRAGAVLPKAGDYTAEMVGAEPTGTAAAVVGAHDSSSNPHPGKFAPVGHNHDGTYALVGHDHDYSGIYAPRTHKHETSDITGLSDVIAATAAGAKIKMATFRGNSFPDALNFTIKPVLWILISNEGLIGLAPYGSATMTLLTNDSTLDLHNVLWDITWSGSTLTLEDAALAYIRNENSTFYSIVIG